MRIPGSNGAAALGFRCEDVRCRFDSTKGEVAALEGVTFAARDHEFICIVGPSGCGKTTLLKVIAGLMEPTAGSIRFDGEPARRPDTGLVFQEHGTFPWMTVLDNVAFGLEMSGTPRAERQQRSMAFVERVGLGPFAHHYPHELSVGMRQRVGVARAFVSGAPILLMDEPFGALDAQTKWVLQQELLDIWSADRKLVVFVTHDIEEAVMLGDRVIVMTGRPGRIREDIPIPLVRPRHLPRDQDSLSEITWHIWQLLEEEVRQGLSIPS
ncbi:MAG: ABC transporter ATP-binding protein [Longimicrobiales bacterium]